MEGNMVERSKQHQGGIQQAMIYSNSKKERGMQGKVSWTVKQMG